MKHLLPLCVLMFFSSATFALTCPSVDEINQTIAANPSKSMRAGDILPDHAGFNMQWVYIDSTHVLTQASKFGSVLLPSERGSAISINCMYDGVDTFNRMFGFIILNEDRGPYTGKTGTWEYFHLPRGGASQCYANDVNTCQFDRMQ